MFNCYRCGNLINDPGSCPLCLNKEKLVIEEIKKEIKTEEEEEESKTPSRFYSKVKKWRDNNPEKIKAQRMIYVLVRNGTLKREKCFCGKKGEAHHEDYSKPLEIKWLCKKHHVIADKERRLKDSFPQLYPHPPHLQVK
jgi:hypothetical protein